MYTFALRKKAKVAAQRQVENELLLGIISSAESSSKESNDVTREMQNQINGLHKVNSKLRNMVVKGKHRLIYYETSLYVRWYSIFRTKGISRDAVQI